MFAETGSGQNNLLSQYVSSIWTASDGLPGNTVTDLIQSKVGYLYIGTYEGLVRFDGIEFKIINHISDKKYSFTSARSVFEDSEGNIWVGANDEGAVRISPNGNVKAFTVKEGLPNNSIRSITEDREGNVWIGTANGIAYITRDDEIKKPLGLEKYSATNIMVLQLYCDTAGRVWATSARENGLYVYENGNFERYKGFETLKDATVYTLTQDKDGAFWFGAGPHYAIHLKGTDETIYDIGFGRQPGTIVNTIYPDSSGAVWFARDTGVAVLKNGKILHYNQGTGLADNNVNSILEDVEGNMWFGTDRGGLEKLSLGKFSTVHMETSVNAICDDPSRKCVWIGADNGLYCYSSSTGDFMENSFTEYCRNIRVRHVELARDGSLLVSTYEKLGQVMMSETQGIRSWTSGDGLTGDRTRVAIQAEDGKIYSGTTNGLNIIDPVDNTIQTINRGNGIPNDYIMCIYESGDHTIWCGTDGGGIFSVVDGHVDKVYTKADGLAGDVIMKIQVLDSPEEIWISTGTGISRFKDGKFSNMGSSSGLFTDTVFQMICDYTGTVWLTSNRGIISMEMSDIKKYMSGEIDYISPKSYGRSDGLISNGITSTSLSMKDYIGRTWFTLIDGFAIYDPLKVANKTVPPVQIERYSLETDSYDYEGGAVTMAPGVKRISIKYTGLSYISPEQIRFRYCLEGFENDYSPWSTAREVSYTNLKPGTYHFRVQAQNSDIFIGELSDPMVIIKKPYVWQLWWFWMMISVCVAAIVVLIISIRYNQMKKYQVKLETEVEEQTRELHQQTIELQKQAEELEIANHNLEKANQQSENLLLNILPKSVANELSEKPGEIIAKEYQNVSVLFADIVDFTKLSDGLSAEKIVLMLNTIFSRFDAQVASCGVEKIKTIGDSYMAASGVNGENPDENSKKMINLALKFFGELEDFNAESPIKLRMRIGINTGNVVAGVIGKTKFIYDIWGDSVNVASRMESTGLPGKIHVTKKVFDETKEFFKFGGPDEVLVKGKGQMQTYFIDVLAD